MEMILDEKRLHRQIKAVIYAWLRSMKERPMSFASLSSDLVELMQNVAFEACENTRNEMIIAFNKSMDEQIGDMMEDTNCGTSWMLPEDN